MNFRDKAEELILTSIFICVLASINWLIERLVRPGCVARRV